MKMQFKTWLENQQHFHSTKELANVVSQFLINHKFSTAHSVEADGNDKIKLSVVDLTDPNKATSAVKYYLKELGVDFKELGFIKEEDPTYNHFSFHVDMPQFDKPAYNKMKNPEMKRRLLSGQTLDVREMGMEVEPGLFKLNQFVDDHDYVDGKKEIWIGSIGKDKQTGEIFAAYDNRFYTPHDPESEYETLWLR